MKKLIMETLSSWGFCHECGLLLTIIRSDPLRPTYPGKSSGQACFSHSPRRIRVPRQADKVSRVAREVRLLHGMAPFALSRVAFRVRLAFTPMHPHHTVNRSTCSGRVRLTMEGGCD
jgi:hypothetical protein